MKNFDMVGTDRLKIHEIFRVLIGDSVDEWRSQRQVTEYCTDWEWADHLLTTHKRFCNNDKCKLARLHDNKSEEEGDSDNSLPVLKPMMNPYVPIQNAMNDIDEGVSVKPEAGESISTMMDPSHSLKNLTCIKTEAVASLSELHTSHDGGSPSMLNKTTSILAPRRNRRKLARTFRLSPTTIKNEDEFDDGNLPNVIAHNSCNDLKSDRVDDMPDDTIGHTGDDEVITVIPRAPDSESDTEIGHELSYKRSSIPGSAISSNTDTGMDRDCSDGEVLEIVENEIDDDQLPSSHSVCTCFLCGDEFTSMSNLKAHLHDHSTAIPNDSSSRNTTQTPIGHKLGLNRARKSFPASRPRIIDFRSATNSAAVSNKSESSFTNSIINMPKLSSLLTGLDVSPPQFITSDVTKISSKIDAHKPETSGGNGEIRADKSDDGTNSAFSIPTLRKQLLPTQDVNHKRSLLTSNRSLPAVSNKAANSSSSNQMYTVKRTVSKSGVSSINVKRRVISCKICDKTFANESSRNSHLRIHSSDRPFKCDYCHMAFNHRSNLKRHIRTHTGEKPWACSICNKKFTRASSVTDHMKLHAGLTEIPEVVKLF